MSEELIRKFNEMTTGTPFVSVNMSPEELEMYLEFRDIMDRLHDDRPGRRRARVSAADGLLKAAHFAAHRHRDQRRLDHATSPYVNHPVAVAEVLARHGVDDLIILQAALLHDTLEDTETTAEELRAEFGELLASVVLEVTDDKKLEKAERKRIQVERAAGLSDRAKMVKVADKICNVRDVGSNPPTQWSLERRARYLDWTEEVVAGCRGMHTGLEACYDRELAEARRRLGEAGGAGEEGAADGR